MLTPADPKQALYTFNAFSFPCTIVNGKTREDGWLYIRNNQTGRHSWADPKYLSEIQPKGDLSC